MLLSEQKCTHFCSEWSMMVGYGTAMCLLSQTIQYTNIPMKMAYFGAIMHTLALSYSNCESVITQCALALGLPCGCLWVAACWFPEERVNAGRSIKEVAFCACAINQETAIVVGCQVFPNWRQIHAWLLFSFTRNQPYLIKKQCIQIHRIGRSRMTRISGVYFFRTYPKTHRCWRVDNWSELVHQHSCGWWIYPVFINFCCCVIPISFPLKHMVRSQVTAWHAGWEFTRVQPSACFNCVFQDQLVKLATCWTLRTCGQLWRNLFGIGSRLFPFSLPCQILILFWVGMAQTKTN